MADSASADKMESIRIALASSSKKKRISQLLAVEEQLRTQDVYDIAETLNLLFATYPFYQDRESRRGVQKCLGSIFTQPSLSYEDAAQFVDSVVSECLKPGIAASNAFVLVEWCSLLTQFLAATGLWTRFGSGIVVGHARVLELCTRPESKKTLAHSAIAITRRGLRRLIAVATKEGHGELLSSVIQSLVDGEPTGGRPCAENTVFLGVIAGVSARSDEAKQILAGLKTKYVNFYTQEVIVSKARVAKHIVSGFRDFFENFTTVADFEDSIAPSLEKGLLRAPEVMLRDVVEPLIESLPPSFDLTNVLNTKLLKPILASAKSTNPDLRAGAVDALKAMLARSSDFAGLDKIVDEIMGPLKGGRLNTPEHRIAHARMLESVPLSGKISGKIATGLAVVASKEGNESALAVETGALAIVTMGALDGDGNGVWSQIADAFSKGLIDKKPAAKRLWLLRVGEILYACRDTNKASPAMISFAERIVGKLADIYKEVVANPSAAAQNGLIIGGLVYCALSEFLPGKLSNNKTAAVADKKFVVPDITVVAKQCLVVDPKASFILTPRIYCKLSAEEDLRWLSRALLALSSQIAETAADRPVKTALAEAIAFTICCPGVPSHIRHEASRGLSQTYARSPAVISSMMIAGLWHLVGRWDGPSTEAEAWLLDGGADNLAVVLRSVCLTPKESAQHGLGQETGQLTRQLCSMLVLARPRLVQRASWIELCLRTETDPGVLATENAVALVDEIVAVTDDQPILPIRTAAYEAAAELAFVAPDALTPQIVRLARHDLRTEELRDVEPLDATIMKATSDVPIVNVLVNNKKDGQQTSVGNKNSKEYELLKWEEETRAQIREKKGQTKSLTAEEAAKIKKQLAKEAKIRKRMRVIQSRVQRGIGIVKALATGPPTDPARWLGPLIEPLARAIEAGACLLTAATGPKAYIACSDVVASRIGTQIRPFIGAATLRARGATNIPKEYKGEPLGQLVTRVLYRLRLAAEQLPLDVISLTYCLPLIVHMLRVGGVYDGAKDAKGGGGGSSNEATTGPRGEEEGLEKEERDAQLVLAIEFLSLHTSVCADERVDRSELLSVLVWSMQRYGQHYKAIRDCFADMCRCMAPNMNIDDVRELAKGTIVAEAAVRTAVLQSINAEVDMSELQPQGCDEIWLACHDEVEENAELGREIWDEGGFSVYKEMPARLLARLECKDEQLRGAAARSVAEACKAVIGEAAAAATKTKTKTTIVNPVLDQLMVRYGELAKPRVQQLDEFGMPIKMDLSDPWHGRHGIAWAMKELAPQFNKEQLDIVFGFLLMEPDGPLSDRSTGVRAEMLAVGLRVIEECQHGKAAVGRLMDRFEETLRRSSSSSPSSSSLAAVEKDGSRKKAIDNDGNSEKADLVAEAVVIMYGALAGHHLAAGDAKIPVVIERLLETLKTPSEPVQYAIAECLPALVRACDGNKKGGNRASGYVARVLEDLLSLGGGNGYAARRGAAYGLAGLVVGRGIWVLREQRIMGSLRAAAENKKEASQREAAFLGMELLATVVGRLFEPYVIEIVPELLAGFGDSNAAVREACLAAAKACFARLTSYGVKRIMPTLLAGLDDQQWRSKKGACDLLGAMAYLDPQQLARSLPDIIPPLTAVLGDSHKEVRLAANKSLKRFGDVIKNPEIKSLVDVLLRALSDPTRHTDEALDGLIRVQFVHYLDAPSLALVIRILQRGLTDQQRRSGTKRKAAQVIGTLAHLTERRDIVPHLPGLVSGLRLAAVDPVPTTRATASRALGSLIEKLGEDAMPDLIPGLMQTLKAESGAGDVLGSAQALSEVLAGLGTARLEETLPTILQNVESPRPAVREGFMSLFIFLPVCFGNSFAAYLGRIVPPILAGLADEIESIRDTALRAGRLLVRNFAVRAVDLLLPELERGLADDSHRIRLSSVELVGDLLFNLAGITKAGTSTNNTAPTTTGDGKVGEDDGANNNKDDDDDNDESNDSVVARASRDAAATLRDVLGEDKRNKILAALYICRCDTAHAVRAAAMAVWKVLVHTPRVLRELTPTLTQLIIRRLGSANMEHKLIASNALGELIRKAGDGVLASLLPTLEEGLHTATDTDARQGICLALKELISSASPEALDENERVLVPVVRTALTDSDADVREAAAEAFDALQHVLGRRAIDQVLPFLLNLLRSPEAADNALQALLTLLTESTRSNAILPNLIPTLTSPPMSAFNARALASLSRVAGAAMARRLPLIINALLDNIVVATSSSSSSTTTTTMDNDDAAIAAAAALAPLADLELALDTVLLSLDDDDGLNTAMNVLLQLLKHDDHHRRAAVATRLGRFFAAPHHSVDYSRYHQDLIRSLLVSFSDSDIAVVKAANAALAEFTRRLRKDEMEALVLSTRQSLLQVGVAGHNLAGFELPRGVGAILPIFLQGLINGTPEQRVASALAISDVADRTSEPSLRPFITQITGPLIRVVSERSAEVRAAILLTLNNLLDKMPAALKPFLPQLQRTFAKSLADTSSDVLRSRAATALGSLITHTPRVDPLVAELVTGCRTIADAGVRTAMLKALYEVVAKAGDKMNDQSRSAVLALIDMDPIDERDGGMTITNARLLGALIQNVSADVAASLLRNRVLVPSPAATNSSVLALNAVLVESPAVLLDNPVLAAELPPLFARGMTDKTPFIADNFILACGKYLLGPAPKSYENTKPIFEMLPTVIQPGGPTDSRRLALVLVRTLSRVDSSLVRPHLALLAPAVFAGVRDMVIPVKLAAEAAFVALFGIADEESAVFDKFIAAHGDALGPAAKRSMTDYFRRVGLRLGQQVRDRRDAEGGVDGALGLSSDEREDERELWRVGREAAGGESLF